MMFMLNTLYFFRCQNKTFAPIQASFLSLFAPFQGKKYEQTFKSGNISKKTLFLRHQLTFQ